MSTVSNKFGMGDGILNYYLYNYVLSANSGFLEVSKIFMSDCFLEQKSWSRTYLNRINISNYQFIEVFYIVLR